MRFNFPIFLEVQMERSCIKEGTKYNITLLNNKLLHHGAEKIGSIMPLLCLATLTK